jgi:uncharacterized membrane protein YphA (DoxX/SURF4 family)
MMPTKTKQNLITWGLKLIAAIIMLQTLYFKFTAAPESVYIFSTLGLEPWGRIGIGIAELIASILLLIPATTIWGAFLAVGLMSGAIFAHLTKLSIEVQNDGGILFVYACIVWLCSIVLLWFNKNQIKYLTQKIISK